MTRAEQDEKRPGTHGEHAKDTPRYAKSSAIHDEMYRHATPAGTPPPFPHEARRARSSREPVLPTLRCPRWLVVASSGCLSSFR
jgi:hypothetical protein